MSHFIKFHFFLLRAYFLKPFVLLQNGLLLSLLLFPYVGAIASWSLCYPLSCFIFPCFIEEHLHGRVMPSTCQSGRGRSWRGHPWAGLTGRLRCCNQVASCLSAGKSPCTCRLRYLPWSYALSLEENSLALCLEGYVQQPEPEHVAKLGVGDLMPFIWTYLQISAQCSASILSHRVCSTR